MEILKKLLEEKLNYSLNRLENRNKINILNGNIKKIIRRKIKL